MVVGDLNDGDFLLSLLLGLLFKNLLELAQIPMKQHLIREGLHHFAVGMTVTITSFPRNKAPGDAGSASVSFLFFIAKE